MTDVEKIVYILKATLHDLPNDKTLQFIAERILESIKDVE